VKLYKKIPLKELCVTEIKKTTRRKRIKYEYKRKKMKGSDKNIERREWLKKAMKTEIETLINGEKEKPPLFEQKREKIFFDLFNTFNPDIFLRSARTRRQIFESLSLRFCRYNQLKYRRAQL